MSYVKTRPGLGLTESCPSDKPVLSNGKCCPVGMVYSTTYGNKCIPATCKGARRPDGGCEATATTPAKPPAPSTDWGGIVQTGLQAITSIFGKPPAAPATTYAPATNYTPWIIGGVVVLGGALFLMRRKGK